jgi:hypothetical protein
MRNQPRFGQDIHCLLPPVASSGQSIQVSKGLCLPRQTGFSSIQRSPKINHCTSTPVIFLFSCEDFIRRGCLFLPLHRYLDSYSTGKSFKTFILHTGLYGVRRLFGALGGF